jgi:SET and MYND domain-containing protein
MLDKSDYVPALIVLLFIYLNCDVYLYPQPHHPVRVIRLFTIAMMLKQVASIQDDRGLMRGVKSSRPSQLHELLKSIDFVSAVQVLLILVKGLGIKSHGETSAFMKEVGEELREVEEIQRQRGLVGQRLKEWMVDDDLEGREYAKKIFEGLRELAIFGTEIVHSK